MAKISKFDETFRLFLTKTTFSHLIVILIILQTATLCVPSKLFCDYYFLNINYFLNFFFKTSSSLSLFFFKQKSPGWHHPKLAVSASERVFSRVPTQRCWAEGTMQQACEVKISRSQLHTVRPDCFPHTKTVCVNLVELRERERER